MVVALCGILDQPETPITKVCSTSFPYTFNLFELMKIAKIA